MEIFGLNLILFKKRSIIEKAFKAIAGTHLQIEAEVDNNKKTSKDKLLHCNSCYLNYYMDINNSIKIRKPVCKNKNFFY
ncbi:MAG: hypothetical protein U1E31_00425 [Rickettsiales bacterium]